MDFDDMSIAELKAAYDFVRQDANELEQDANKNHFSAQKIGAYPEVKQVENALYNALLNKTRDLLSRLMPLPK